MLLLNEDASRTIVHMDLDSFFVSVSTLLNPILKGKPVLVGGGSDRGVVAACSYETRKFGIHSAMPMKLARRLCPDAIIIKGDYESYTKKSEEVTEIIREKVPLYEKSSIDEFYMDLSGMDRFFGCYKWATELRQQIIKETGLPISFGMSKNKTVSKIATDEAKPNSQMKIDSGTEKTFLAPLSVSKIPMIGEKTSQVLRSMGVHKVFTLQQMPPELLQDVLGENGLSIWKKANGIDHTPVIPYSERKSISSEETFDSDTIDLTMMRSMLIKMTEKLTYQLRYENKLSSCVTVKIRYSNFDTYTMQCRTPYTSCDHHLIPRVKELFDKLFSRRMLIRLIGVRFSHLVGGSYQINLFEDNESVIKLYQAMDKIRRVYGTHAIERAVGGVQALRAFNPFNGIASGHTEEKSKEKDAKEYKLIMPLPKSLCEELTRMNEGIRKKYGMEGGSKPTPHITLMRCWLSEKEEDKLIDNTEKVSRHHHPVPVSLQQFKSAGADTLCLNVERSAALTRLLKSLQAQLNLRRSQSFFSYLPHVEITNNLHEKILERILAACRSKSFQRSFTASQLVLMKREAGHYERVKSWEL